MHMDFSFIVAASAGSLAVAAVGLVFALFQGWVALRRPEFAWNSWGAAISLAAAVYSLAVFLQFNLPAGGLTRIVERIQFSAFLGLVAACQGFANAYFGRPPVRGRKWWAAGHLAWLGLLWGSDLIVGPAFTARHFLWLPRPYVEPALGPLGMGYIGYTLALALATARLWVAPALRRQAGATGFCLAFGLWVLLGLHDILATLGMTTVRFLMEFGFLGFSLAAMAVTLRKYVELFAVAETSQAQLQRVNAELEGRVRQRTDQLERSNRELRLRIDEREKAVEALRASEERFRTLIANITDVIFVLDAEGIIRYKSPNVTRHFGWRPEELVGTPGWGYVHADDRPRVQEAFTQVLAAPGRENTAEFRYRTRDGRYRTIRMTAVNRLDHPLVRGVVGSYRDVTERQQAEAEKLRLEGQLRQAQKMESLGTLAGGIAHDFNNILSPIMGFTEMTLADLPPAHTARGNLGEVLKAAKRARDMVQQILTFSRHTAPELKPMKIAPVIEEAVKLLRSTLPATIDIHLALGREAGFVMGDSTQVHQMIVNLGTNAYHAMRPQGGRLEIGLEEIAVGGGVASPGRELAPGTYGVITVKDTGHGMAPEILDRIFDPYFTTKPKGEGTGMGLAVVLGIVKGHGGSIQVDSRPGAGTTFRIYLPQMAVAVEAAVHETTDTIPLGFEHILMVDDEPQLLDLARQMLERLGYRVTTAASGVEALARFRRTPEAFDLVVTDQTMPHLTGAELAGELMRLRPQTPVLLCTGFSETMDPERARAMGLQGFLLKPVSMKSLATTVREVLNARSQGPPVTCLPAAGAAPA
jgi:PAS domain S-box-containing protein